jgi:hypothetical protein
VVKRQATKNRVINASRDSIVGVQIQPSLIVSQLNQGPQTVI